MRYTPIVLHTVQDRYGYWTVTVSIAPGRHVDVMIAVQGITPARAAQLALESLPDLVITQERQ